MSNVIVTYNGSDITKACDSAQLSATIAEIESTNLNSTGKESSPGQTEWRIELSGYFSKDLDNAIGADAAAPQKRAATIQFGPSGNRVLYTWGATACFVSNYTIDASNPSESLRFSATLSLSGAPARSTPA
jgi:hypothetical protein